MDKNMRRCILEANHEGLEWEINSCTLVMGVEGNFMQSLSYCFLVAN